ncbi:hypothetical protein [Alkalihalobacillus deserti]|uniref:hypothetical protein n=1 Tax=Alkalihalobacillus deserti TaxID=2879466 RepID=UPI001D137DBD|nr:hypothetical protein [Alkalihalobacillus deserti]
MQHHITLVTLALPWKSDLESNNMEIYSHTTLLSDIDIIQEGRDIALKGQMMNFVDRFLIQY